MFQKISWDIFHTSDCYRWKSNVFISLNHRAKDDSIKSKYRVHRQILIIILPLIPQILHTFKSRLAVLRDHLSTTHTHINAPRTYRFYRRIGSFFYLEKLLPASNPMAHLTSLHWSVNAIVRIMINLKNEMLTN